MARKAIMVRENGGFYDIALGADPESWTDIRRAVSTIEVVEGLMGWGPYRWAVKADGADYFVTGAAEPRERGLSR